MKQLNKYIKNMAYKKAENSNSICPWFLYQPRLPEKIKALKKKI